MYIGKVCKKEDKKNHSNTSNQLNTRYFTFLMYFYDFLNRALSFVKLLVKMFY